VELKPFGIDVIIVEPGGVATEFPQVAAERLLATSGHGAYAQYARRYAASLRSEAKGISSPDVIARTITRAATVRRPRTRYAVGRGAKAVVLARWLLPDRAYDRLLVATFDTLNWVTARRAAKSADRDVPA
jgi:NAD(P)-dependent dehydrogenase (short-subunit alcohol dehydrogenase family)